MTTVDVPTDNTGTMFYEATPDVEVTLLIMQGEKLQSEVPANVNISKTVFQFKEVIARHFNLNLTHIQIWKGDVQLSDEKRILEYEIDVDDELVVKYPDQ